MTLDDPVNGFILQLPDELQIKILGYLPPTERLRAAGVPFDGTLWAKIDARPFYRVIPSEQLLHLGMAAGKFLREANFRGCLQLTGHGLRTLSNFCPNIHNLQLRDCRSLSTHSIACFLHSATQLHALDLSCLDTVTNTTLINSVSQLPLLERLNISWCRNVSGHGVQAIARSCVHLTTLILNGCSQLDETTMATLGRCLTHIQHLSVASCTSLTDQALLAFLQNELPQLSHLNVSQCARLSDTSLRHIALHTTPQLSKLELAGCVLLTDQGFCFLAPRVTSLVHLDLEDLQQITGSTVKALANNEPRLQHFSLANCTHIADDAIIHLVLYGVCRHLSHLELDNSMITDRALHTIAMSLRERSENGRTTTLHIQVLDCANVSEEGIKSAMSTAGPVLSIKSFYSWQDIVIQDEDDENEEQGIMTRRRSRRRTYNTIGHQRRRPDAAGQPNTINCIIL
ncbi:f-box lrr-repeat protein 20 isoform 1 [Lichtheimia corymbifera JMRC:FSU:9682]|uniref:F-box lrr-repeat protein 20 isoform 1 n=1 Tax=Lichtheimia corymbifera JMRC:FSU:9682 TaxID=1263082 RepID=A0A068RDV1_9FUNG|nr:f-box lrr-repeat protein 20 isoform 1 [Lichtheimia corymbifera JMRC:FSU:9682]